MTVDEQLEHLLTDHKILLFRYDASLRKEIAKKLNEMQRKMILRISSVGIESLSKRELVKLLSEIKEIVKEYYQTIYHFTDDELQALLPIEALAVWEIYNTAVKFDLSNRAVKPRPLGRGYKV